MVLRNLCFSLLTLTVLNSNAKVIETTFAVVNSKDLKPIAATFDGLGIDFKFKFETPIKMKPSEKGQKPVVEFRAYTVRKGNQVGSGSTDKETNSNFTLEFGYGPYMYNSIDPKVMCSFKGILNGTKDMSSDSVWDIEVSNLTFNKPEANSIRKTSQAKCDKLLNELLRSLTSKHSFNLKKFKIQNNNFNETHNYEILSQDITYENCNESAANLKNPICYSNYTSQVLKPGLLDNHGPIGQESKVCYILCTGPVF